MSQHDFDLANQGGAGIRADMNNALLALVSRSSGATEPATTYAYMLWADTTSGWIKQRNAANSAWIKLAPLGDNSRVDVASAATIDLDANAVTANYVRITGTTTITAVTLASGQRRIALAGGAFQITNGASLIVPGAANYTCVAGDVLLFMGEAAGVVRVMIWRGDGTPVVPGGKQTIWIPAGAMISRTTNGAAAGTAETTTNKVMLKTLDFDASTQEYAQFSIQMPKSWNEGTVTFVPVWSHASTTTNFGVVWELQGLACSDDDALDTAFGTAQTSTDTGGTTNDLYRGPESAAITLAGTPAANDVAIFQIGRKVADGSDTMAIDARLHGVALFYTTDAANDA